MLDHLLEGRKPWHHTDKSFDDCEDVFLIRWSKACLKSSAKVGLTPETGTIILGVFEVIGFGKAELPNVPQMGVACKLADGTGDEGRDGQGESIKELWGQRCRGRRG